MDFKELTTLLISHDNEKAHTKFDTDNKFVFSDSEGNNHNTSETIQKIYKQLGNVTKIHNTEDTCVFQLDKDESKGFVVAYSNQGFRSAGEPKEYYGTTITFVQNKEDIAQAIQAQATLGNWLRIGNTQNDIDRVSFSNDDSTAFQLGKTAGHFVKNTINSVLGNISSIRKKSLNDTTNKDKPQI